MQLLPVVTSSTIVSLEHFWHALLLYHDKPHVINRKIAGVVQLNFCALISEKIKQIHDIFTYTGILYEIRKLKEINRASITDEFLKSFIEPYDKKFKLVAISAEEFKKANSGVFISVRILLSRIKLCPDCIEIVIMDKDQNRASFLAVSKDVKLAVSPPFVYHIEHTRNGNVRICLESIENCETSNADWICNSVFSKILKWAEDVDEPEHTASLSLVDIDIYYQTYSRLKEKYYENLVKIWTENTDPKKFIHEDLAIASYLISIFEKYGGSRVQNFVDLGCGNGLLVYILNQEGYPGLGIDVRRRKIWDVYPQKVDLQGQSDANLLYFIFVYTLILFRSAQEKTLIPSSDFLFPEADWIIGNHSDELSPWIPVIALRSSQKTNFFVLPCCAYDFSGQKYKRLNTSKSQYSEYLEYINTISVLCGFQVHTDKLRIPSTKRTCMIGTNRTFKTEDFKTVSEKVTKFINERVLNDGKCTPQSTDWIQKFEPRASVERVRNCTQINKDIINKIIHQAVAMLLETKNYINKSDEGSWNKGGSVSLSAFSKSLSKEDCVHLKKECGGLKTLLKNHRYIFDVAKDQFELRKPYLLSETNKYKDKPCWFEQNHPDKCLYSAKQCAYKHM